MNTHAGRRNTFTKSGKSTLAWIGAPSALFVAATVVTHATPPTLTGIGFLPSGGASECRAVSTNGSVAVGWSDSPSGRLGFYFDRPSATMHSLGVAPGGMFSDALAVCVGGYHIAGCTGMPEGDRGFRWGAGTFIDVGALPGGYASQALGISGGGSVVVGWSESALGVHAFRWQNGTLLDLGILPGGITSRAYGVSSDGTVTVGESDSAQGIRAFRWAAETGLQNLGALEGGTASRARAVSAGNLVIVGEATASSGEWRPFRWTHGTGMVDLGTLPGDPSGAALAADAQGWVIVGYAATPDGVRHAMIWDESNGMFDLRSLLQERGVDTSGWTLTEARGISGDGIVIVGSGIHNGAPEGWIVTLPECQAAAVASQPADQQLRSGQVLTLHADVSGDPPMTLQWRHDGTDLVDGERISGAATPTLSIADVALEDQGRYDLRVSNFCGTEVSRSATVTVLCAADWNLSGIINSQDYFDFVTDFFTRDADFNGDGLTNSQDYFDFVTAYFSPC